MNIFLVMLIGFVTGWLLCKMVISAAIVILQQRQLAVQRMRAQREE